MIMPDAPKNKPDPSNLDDNADEKGAWAEDQKKHGYYYDDACGYEVYQAENDEEKEDDD